MTAEPPKGLRANVFRLYNQTTEDSFQQCKAQSKYQKLFFTLAYFHSVLLERRKFGTLGLNIPYDFNDTDFQVSDDLLKTYLDAYEKTPFDALKFLISEANYGGRVTDEIDRRVLSCYLNQFYSEETISVPNFPLSTIQLYHVPDDGTLQTHKEFIQTWPTVDRPEAFGQHANADIASQLSSSRLMLTTIAGLQPKSTGVKGGVSQEDTVMNIATDLLQQVPEPFDLADIQSQKSGDPSALHTVLFQEIERYNILLRQIRESCLNLQKGIQGLVVMSPELETMYKAFSEAKVPAKWIKSYPSLKPLGPWTRDLLQRIGEIKAWAEGTYPTVYWLAGFTYPADFLTAVMQTTARRNLVPIDTLAWDFSIVNREEADIAEPAREGIYVKGLFLEGAGWDRENECLQEPRPMELIVPMPIMHFKPVVSKKKAAKGVYMCPLYLYPIRTGSRERPSFLLYVTLKSGSMPPDHWVKRGTALLLALAN